MKKLKEKILKDNQLPTSSSTDRPTPSISSSTDRFTPSTSSPTDNFTPSIYSSTTKPSDTCIYGVCTLAVIAIGVCVFFPYNTSQAANKKQVNEKQDQPPKRRHMLWKKDIIKMSSFDWNKNIEDSIKDGLILTATTTGIFFALKAANVKLPKASLDAMDIIKLAGGICGGELMIDYVAYKKWINE